MSQGQDRLTCTPGHPEILQHILLIEKWKIGKYEKYSKTRHTMTEQTEK